MGESVMGTVRSGQRPSGLRARGMILVVATAVAGILACEKPERCGDGVVGPQEACDDGNLTGGDGCSATCQLDDILATPGDDRAGYVICSNPYGGPSVTCGPGFGCCNDPGGATCAASIAACVSPFDFQGCDGDEDCGAGPCWVYRDTDCSLGTGYEVRCHVDADCPHPGDVCNAAGHCPTFSLPTSLSAP